MLAFSLLGWGLQDTIAPIAKHSREGVPCRLSGSRRPQATLPRWAGPMFCLARRARTVGNSVTWRRRNHNTPFWPCAMLKQWPKPGRSAPEACIISARRGTTPFTRTEGPCSKVRPWPVCSPAQDGARRDSSAQMRARLARNPDEFNRGLSQWPHRPAPRQRPQLDESVH